MSQLFTPRLRYLICKAKYLESIYECKNVCNSHRIQCKLTNRGYGIAAIALEKPDELVYVYQYADKKRFKKNSQKDNKSFGKLGFILGGLSLTLSFCDNTNTLTGEYFLY